MYINFLQACRHKSGSVVRGNSQARIGVSRPSRPCGSSPPCLAFLACDYIGPRWQISGGGRSRGERSALGGRTPSRSCGCYGQLFESCNKTVLLLTSFPVARIVCVAELRGLSATIAVSVLPGTVTTFHLTPSQHSTSG